MFEQRQQWNPPPRAPLVGAQGSADGEDPDRDDPELACEAETPHSRDEAAVRAVIDAIGAAVRGGDVEAMLAQCSPDVVTFDMVEPIQHEGVNSVRRVWLRTLAEFVPPIEYDALDIQIEVGGDVAFVRCLNEFGGTRRDGRPTLSHLRATFGLTRSDGVWKVVHEHVSVPFDMVTGKALLDLDR